jgi:hypothetical protein
MDFFEILLSIVSLIKGAFILSIPVFFIVLIASFLRKKIENYFKLQWFSSALITTIIFFLAIVSILYYFPFLLALNESRLGILPIEFQPTFFESFSAFLLSLIHVIIVAIVLTVLIIPIEFFGLFLTEALEQKFKLNKLINLFVTVFCLTTIVSSIILFVFPWIVSGMIYFIYFSR